MHTDHISSVAILAQEFLPPFLHVFHPPFCLTSGVYEDDMAPKGKVMRKPSAAPPLPPLSDDESQAAPASPGPPAPRSATKAKLAKAKAVVVPPGANKSSQQSREEAKAALDLKIEEFKARVKARPKEQQGTVDMAMLKTSFTANELSAVWDRLKQARAKSTMSVREAWTCIENMKTGVKDLKRQVLVDYLCGEPNDWVNRLVTFQKTATKGERAAETFTPMTRGQLVAMQGEEETERAINGNKYDIIYDSDDEPQYIKKQKVITRFRETAETATSSRSCIRNKFCIVSSLKIVQLSN